MWAVIPFTWDVLFVGHFDLESIPDPSNTPDFNWKVQTTQLKMKQYSLKSLIIWITESTDLSCAAGWEIHIGQLEINIHDVSYSLWIITSSDSGIQTCLCPFLYNPINPMLSYSGHTSLLRFLIQGLHQQLNHRICTIVSVLILSIHAIKRIMVIHFQAALSC